MHKGRTVQFCAREAILDWIDEVEERFLAVDRISEEESVDGYDLLEWLFRTKVGEIEFNLEIGRGGRIWTDDHYTPSVFFEIPYIAKTGELINQISIY